LIRALGPVWATHNPQSEKIPKEVVMGEDPARKALNAIVDALQDLQSADRKRAVLGALHFLDEDWVPLPQKTGKAAADTGTGRERPEANGAFSPSVQAWMDKNELTEEMVEQVFAFDNGRISIIGDVPGKGKREKSIAIYTLMGLGTFLQTGERLFQDDIAREACSTHSAYDQSNHAGTMREMRNEITGDKASGWTITMPGLKKGAAIVREIIGNGK
jgi:hypothetical protein